MSEIACSVVGDWAYPIRPLLSTALGGQNRLLLSNFVTLLEFRAPSGSWAFRARARAPCRRPAAQVNARCRDERDPISITIRRLDGSVKVPRRIQ